MAPFWISPWQSRDRSHNYLLWTLTSPSLDKGGLVDKEVLYGIVMCRIRFLSWFHPFSNLPQQCQTGRHNYRQRKTIIPSSNKIREVVTEESSGQSCVQILTFFLTPLFLDLPLTIPSHEKQPVSGQLTAKNCNIQVPPAWCRNKWTLILLGWQTILFMDGELAQLVEQPLFTAGRIGAV
jgi:hypothetical protein